MDPDETLHELQIALVNIRHAQANNDQQGEEFAATTIIDAAEALNGWLCKGGFLPKLWQANR